jgi:DNA-binding MarR family transcriptional regulator
MLTMNDSHVNISQTYVYKFRTLSNLLERAFDTTLREHVHITLAQTMLLLTLLERPGSNQRQLAKHLGVSAVAIKRQVDLAKQAEYITSMPTAVRGEGLGLTPKGNQLVVECIGVLEQHVFSIFCAHNQSLNLMQHLDLLVANTTQLLKRKNST